MSRMCGGLIHKTVRTECDSEMAHGFEQTHLSYIPGTRLSRTDTKMPSTDDPPPVDTMCALPSAATPTTPPLSTCHPPDSRVACVRERAFLHRSTVEKEQKISETDTKWCEIDQSR